MAWSHQALTTSIQKWAKSTASDFVAVATDVIRLAETRIFRDTNLHIYNITASGTLTSGTNTITLPTDLAWVRSLQVLATTATDSTATGILQQKHETFLKEYAPVETNTAPPRYYAIADQTTLKLAPTPDSNYNYQLNYRANPSSLNTATDGTWLSAHGEDLLFYSCMVESCLFLQKFGIMNIGEQVIDHWEKQYQRALLAFKGQYEVRLTSNEYRVK